MKNITNNQKVIVIIVLIILGIFCLYKWSNVSKNKADENVKVTDVDAPVSEDISDASSDMQFELNDDAILGITPVSPDKGFVTGLKEYPLLTWRINKIVEKTKQTNINVKYPYFLGGEKVTKLNGYVESYIQKTIKMDRKELKDIINAGPNSDRFSSLDLSVGYRVIGVINGIVSLEMVNIDFTGGGNGNHSMPVIINWDLKKDRLLKTNELFCSKDYLSMIKPLARDRLLVDIKNNPNVEVDFLKAKSTIEEGTMDSSNYEDIMPYKNGVIVVFPPYSILSGIFGILRVYIPDTNNLLCLP